MFMYSVIVSAASLRPSFTDRMASCTEVITKRYVVASSTMTMRARSVHSVFLNLMRGAISPI